MCGRYTANTEDEVIEVRRILARLALRIVGTTLSGSGREVFPTERADIITAAGGLHPAKWGFDKWEGSGVIINARGETAATSKFFAGCLQRGRCAVPASGYFEWRKAPDKRSEKYAIKTGSPGGIFMAGLAKPGADDERFVIITRPPQPEIAFIHDRMPLLLSELNLSRWLRGEVLPGELIREQEALLFERVG